MSYNINSGYGKLTQSVPFLGGGQTFVVAKSSAAGRDILQNLFIPSTDGVNRYAATLDTAVGYCTASRGDVIYVAPGHTETISSATALALDVAGITVIGLGSGVLTPTFTLDTATTATIGVTANDITLKNLRFRANFADIVSLFTIGAAKNFKVDGCDIGATATNMNFLYLFDTNTTTAAADGLTMLNSKWIEPDAATISMCKVDGTNDSWVFKNNYVSIACQATGGGMFVIAAGKVLTNVEVESNRCRFIGGDLSGAGVVFTTNQSTNSGHFSNNFIQHTDTAAEIFGTASSGFSFFENRMSGVAGATGYVLPTVDS